MQNLTSITGLRNAIELLKAEQAYKGQLFKEQFSVVLVSLKPVNLIKSTLKDICSSPYLADNLSATAIGLAAGYLTKKIVVGSSGNMVRKLLGSIMQFGVTNFVAQHSDTIKSFGQIIVKHFFRKKEMNSQKP